MADKIKELEGRLDRLENRLKTTFLEVEKRFEEFKTEQPILTSVEERIAEVEDLLLLLQLEVTKIKETSGGGLEFGAPAQEDVNERLKKIEDFISSHEIVEEKTATPEARGAAVRAEQLEKRVAALESNEQPENRVILSVERELDEIGRRLDKLEGKHEKEYTKVTHAKPARKVHETERIEGRSVLADVRKILQSP